MSDGASMGSSFADDVDEGTAKDRRRGVSIVVLEERVLPDHFLRVVQVFDTLDRIYCFLARRKLSCTIRRFAQLYGEMMKVSELGAVSLPIETIATLFSLKDGKFCELRTPGDTDGTAGEVEMTFFDFQGYFGSHSKQRKKTVLETLSSLLLEKYHQVQQQLPHHSERIKENKRPTTCATIARGINKKGWPHWFNAADCSLPPAHPYALKVFEQYLHDSSQPSCTNQTTEALSSVMGGSQLEHNNTNAILLDAQTYLVSQSTEEKADSNVIVRGGEAVLLHLQSLPFYAGQLVHVEHIRGRSSSFADLSGGPLPSSLHQRLLQVLNMERLQLFSHQARGIDALRNGRHVVVSTSTASGKSLIYNVPVIERAMINPQVTALYMFPTKALAQDQLRSLLQLTGSGLELPVGVAVCDGDTNHSNRAAIQGRNDAVAAAQQTNIILTNPDMLHCTMLPQHKSWSRIYRNLRFVVIDEAHLYRGAFGAHVAAVIRRLLRVCLLYGSVPQFICCSATIANPAEHMRRLVPIHLLPRHLNASSDELEEDALEVIDSSCDGSPQSDRLFAIWNPPLRQNMEKTKLPQQIPTRVANVSTYSREDGVSPPANDELDSRDERIAALPSESMLPPGISPQKQRFFTAVADARPATLGPSRAAIVKYHQLGSESPTSINNRVPQLNSWPLPLDITVDAEKEQQDAELLEVTYVGGWKRGKNRKCDASAVTEKLNKVSRTSVERIPSSQRVSTICEAAHLFSALVQRRLRTIAFCKVRKLVELVLGYTQRNLRAAGAENLLPCVSSYRGGYTKEERRDIEKSLFSGELLGVTATCALELGIDVGALDVTLHMGFPGTFASLWQQAGRAGRSGRTSLSIIVCFECPIDQFFARNPKLLFHSEIESAMLDVNNPHILSQHLHYAAKELPINFPFHSRSCGESADDMSFDALLFGEKFPQLVQLLISQGKLVPMKQCHLDATVGDKGRMNEFSRHFWPHQHLIKHAVASSRLSWDEEVMREAQHMSRQLWRAPSDGGGTLSLRMIDPITISIVDDSRGGVLIDSLGYSRAFFELYEGAIYMHRAQQYLVQRLDLLQAKAHTRPVSVRYYTSARNKTTVSIIKPLEVDECAAMGFGVAQVVSSVFGFVKHSLSTGEVFEKADCSLPPLEYETIAFWIDLPLYIKQQLEAANCCPISSMHAANHLLVALCPLYAQCEESDLGTEHAVARSKLEHPWRMLVFDKRTGGLGACNELFSVREHVLRSAYQALSECSCSDGCPSCILDARCTNYNHDLCKRGALLLLQLLLEHVSFSSNSAQTDHGLVADQGVNKRIDSISAAAPRSPPRSCSINDQKIDPTPRKAKRKRSLRQAVFRNSDRAKRIAVQMNWSDCVPSFVQDGNGMNK